MTTPRWEDLEEGTPGPAPLAVGPITRTDIVRYQGASGDMNPIHHDEPFAAAAGYPAPLAVGMFGAGVLHGWGAAWLGPEHVRRVRMRWKDPVFPGDVLTCSGRVVKKYEEGGERKVDVELTCCKQGGAVAIQGFATYVVP
jgi:acyl dehydratase